MSTNESAPDAVGAGVPPVGASRAGDASHATALDPEAALDTSNGRGFLGVYA